MLQRLSSGPRTQFDALAILTAYALLLLAIPSRLTIAALGGVGAPATLLALGAAALWVWSLSARSDPFPVVIQPIRRATLFLLAALAVSFAAGTMRPISPEELQSSQTSLLVAFGLAGVALIACDQLPTRKQLDRLLSRLSLIIGFFAAFGVVQYISGQPLTDFIQLPGLSLNSTLTSISVRDGINRPSSTALHAIEFGVAVTAALPVCLHVALHRVDLSALRRWFPVVAIGLAVPLSVSRSAIVGMGIVLVMLVPSWPRQLRLYSLVSVGLLGTAVFVMMPGVIGTVTGLFTNASEDPSALSRTGSYELAMDFVGQSPWFGRGFGTFLPRYRILDNQYLGLLIDAGILGLAALLTLFVTAIVCGILTSRRSQDAVTRDLAMSLAVSVTVSTVAFALFDAFSFPLFSGLTFLLIGASGALYRLEGRDVSYLWQP